MNGGWDEQISVQRNPMAELLQRSFRELQKERDEWKELAQTNAGVIETYRANVERGQTLWEAVDTAVRRYRNNHTTDRELVDALLAALSPDDSRN